MKAFQFLLGLAFFVSQLNAQQDHREKAKDGAAPYLIGKINKNSLIEEPYADWFNKNYEDYQPNKTIIDAISKDLTPYSITLFMGTWCGDSKEEVPRFYKVLEACDFPMEQLTVIAVSNESSSYKQSPNHEEKGLNIHRVPTFIFSKNDKEVKRIVEHPIQSFEEDIKTIISSKPYKPNYQIVEDIHSILEKKGIKGLNRKTKKLIKIYKAKVSSISELNAYGYVLYTTNRLEEASEVFKMNTELFPEQPKTFLTLANTLAIMGKKEDAIKVMENALLLHPKNSDLKENLQVLKSN